MSMSLVNSTVATIIIVWGTAHALTTRAHTRQADPTLTLTLTFTLALTRTRTRTRTLTPTPTLTLTLTLPTNH